MFAEEGAQLSGRRNLALGRIRDGTDLSVIVGIDNINNIIIMAFVVVTNGDSPSL